jgi:hypothetical protein
MITCLLVLSLYSVTSWVHRRRLLDLVWFAFGSALLLGTGYEMSGWVLAAVGVVAIEEWRRRVSAAEKRAVLLVALLPLIYMAALWILMCWLIMGDPLYAMRSLMAAGPGPGSALILPDLIWWSYACLAMLVGWMLVLALRGHDRGGVCLAVLGLALPGAAGLMAWREQLWDAAPLLLSLLPAAVLALGHWLANREQGVTAHGGGSSTRQGRRSVGVWLLACLPLILADVVPLALSGGSSRSAAASSDALQSPWLPELERHIRRQTPFAKVFVCGFESFALLQTRTSLIFEHALDFNSEKSKRDYHGHVLYVLVPRPEQRNAMESIQWKNRNIYVQGGRDALYDSDWGNWRLFELIQATMPR